MGERLAPINVDPFKSGILKPLYVDLTRSEREQAQTLIQGSGNTFQLDLDLFKSVLTMVAWVVVETCGGHRVESLISTSNIRSRVA